LPRKKTAKMAERKWLNDLFLEKSAWGVRQFLYECGKRWKSLSEGPLVEEPKEKRNGLSFPTLFAESQS